MNAYAGKSGLIAGLLDRLPVAPLAVLAVVLGILPITPEPHLLEKSRMLLSGELTKPIDIFDLLFHASGLVLLGVKMIRNVQMKRAAHN